MKAEDLLLAVQELRVHGVSGTPPRDILYTDPITYGKRGASTNVYRAPATDPCFETSAFHWANLTSGSRITALWILLAPYALANAAGWMAGWQSDPTSGTGPGAHQSWHGRLGRMSIRCAGLALTALLVAQSLTAGVLLPMRWLAQNGSAQLGAVRVGVAVDQRLALSVLVIGAAFVFWWLVAIVSTRTHFPEVERVSTFELLFDLTGDAMTRARDEDSKVAAPGEDPGGALVTDSRLWAVHPMLHRLRRAHFAVGLGILSMGVLYWTGLLTPVRGLVIALLVFALIGWLLTYVPTTVIAWRGIALAPHASLLLFIGSVTSIWTTAPAQWHPGSLHSLTFGISIVLAIFAVGALGAGPLSLGALVLATFFGVVLGTTVGLLIDNALGTGELVGEGVGWVAVAMLALIAWLLLVSLVLAGRRQPNEADPANPPTDRTNRRLILLRRVVLQARVLFYSAGAFGIVAAAYVAIAVWRLGVASGGTGLLGVIEAGLDPAALGTFPGFLIRASVAIAIVGPGYFAIRSLRKGWISEEGGRGRRRQVGILWDLGSFWPRWYHPLAPPAYGPSAVRDLGEIIDEMPDGSLLAAHSQGSLIAAVTLFQRMPEVGLITYGSPLGILYPRMFPSTGIPQLVAAVSRGVPLWVNLWRRTDPIGGEPVSVPGVENRHVDEGAGHSKYEPTPTYSLTRREAAGITEGPC